MGGFLGIDKLFIFTSSWRNSIEEGQLVWDTYDGSDVVIHYYTHDFSRKPWRQIRFWDADRKYEKSSKEIVRVLH